MKILLIFNANNSLSSNSETSEKFFLDEDERKGICFEINIFNHSLIFYEQEFKAEVQTLKSQRIFSSKMREKVVALKVTLLIIH